MTKAQQLASSPDHSVWVAASAGTGKTKVLTDRVLRLLLEGVPPKKILCLTFTNAAAAEMATRIRKKLGEWVMLPDAALIHQLEQLTGHPPPPCLVMRVRTLFAEVLDAAEGPAIQTIHAFCQSLISRFPLEAGVQPNSRIIDDRVAKELLEEAKNRLLNSNNEVLGAFSWRMAESSFTELVEEIVNQSGKFIRLFQNHPLPELEIKTYAALNALPGVEADAIIAQTCEGGSLNEPELKLLATAWLQGTPAEAKRGELLARWLASPIEKRIAIYPSYLSLFLTKEGKAAQKLLNKATLAAYPETGFIVQHEQQRLLDAEEQRKSQHSAEMSLRVLHIADSLLAIYRDLKSKHGFLDYNDLIHISTSLLSDSSASAWILYKLDGGIDHILVDEAQDTSPSQWDIVDALSAEFFSGYNEHTAKRSLFVVGDEKQSIYSFQGADPRKFQAMHEDFSTRAKQAMYSWQSVALDKSFRSTEAILQAVDNIFASLSLPTQHKAHREGQAGKVEVWQPFAEEKKEAIEPWPLPIQHHTKHTAVSRLAEKIADNIAGWLESGRLLTSKNRPVMPGDIMILVRRRNPFTGEMIKALKQRHIPVSGADRLVLSEHIAVMDLIALGKFLLLPQDDLNLVTVLKTPLIGLSEEELFTLVYQRGEMSVWEALKASGSLFHHAYTYLSSLLKYTDFDTPFALFNDILEVRGGRKQFLARLGHEANDALDEFLSLALEYQQLYTPSLQGFLHWLETSQVEIKRDMEQGANQVRIMTVHGSKGLQAPIVFLPDTMQLPMQQDRLLWSDELVFWPGSKKDENRVCAALRESRKEAEMEEYYRLLYVALTRPEDELYIGGYYGQSKPSEKCWHTVICKGLGVQEKDIPAGEILLSLTSEQKVPLPANTNKAPDNQPIILPEYFLQAPRHVTSPTHVTRPSGIEVISPFKGQQRIAMLRGTLIHRLLEFLPTLPPEQQQARAALFLEQYRGEIPPHGFDTLLQDVTRLLNHKEFRFIFSSYSRAEVAVSGIVDGHRVSGRIDRLAITDHDVWVIDYKTQVPGTVIPAAYREQLMLYKKLVAPLYPEKTIRCALLFTTTLEWMEI